MRELIYTSSREVAKGHYVHRTVTDNVLRNIDTMEMRVETTTKFKCACGENEYKGSLSMAAYQEIHQQLMEAAQ
jgi:hypothetical protein